MDNRALFSLTAGLTLALLQVAAHAGEPEKKARSIPELQLDKTSGVADEQSIPPELFGVTKTTTPIEAFRPTPQFERHDPSNIIRHDGRYWVFYTRNISDHNEVSVHSASSVDGYQWSDLREALGLNSQGSWDESGTSAPWPRRPTSS